MTDILPPFEDLSKQNGMTWWSAREFMLMLGYDDWDVFKKLIYKTMKNYLESDWFVLEEEFRHYTFEDGDYTVEDYKLSRFACYVLAMNADASHKEVAEAQAFFAKTMENFQEQLSSEDVERLGIRIQLKEAFKDLNKTFKKQDGKDYGRFNQAGLIGMYNKGNWDLAKHRQVDPKKLYETMSRTELAANLFRVTQTEERIKNEMITGQGKLEKAHKDVGKEVREMVKRNTGVYPEALPQAELPAPKIESQLKKAHKKLKKMDE
jgi:DNA-damage-inducible protein D